MPFDTADEIGSLKSCWSNGDRADSVGLDISFRSGERPCEGLSHQPAWSPDDPAELAEPVFTDDWELLSELDERELSDESLELLEADDSPDEEDSEESVEREVSGDDGGDHPPPEDLSGGDGSDRPAPSNPPSGP